ncbi:MAG TPA: hypothetical protein VFA26_08495, partial [Gemmataceae bacterium]|nr:hypothetical protein [Gemmataceae bacterium]
MLSNRMKKLLKWALVVAVLAAVSLFVIQEASAQRYRAQMPGPPNIGPLNGVGYPQQQSYVGGANGGLAGLGGLGGLAGLGGLGGLGGFNIGGGLGG